MNCYQAQCFQTDGETKYVINKSHGNLKYIYKKKLCIIGFLFVLIDKNSYKNNMHICKGSAYSTPSLAPDNPLTTYKVGKEVNENNNFLFYPFSLDLPCSHYYTSPSFTQDFAFLIHAYFLPLHAFRYIPIFVPCCFKSLFSPIHLEQFLSACRLLFVTLHRSAGLRKVIGSMQLRPFGRTNWHRLSLSYKQTEPQARMLFPVQTGATVGNSDAN